MNYNSITWTPGETIEDIERKIIKAALQFFRGNKTQTAQSLGIAIRTLDNKIEKYGQEDELKAAREKEREQEMARKRADFHALGGKALDPRPEPEQIKPPKSKEQHEAVKRSKQMLA